MNAFGLLENWPLNTLIILAQRYYTRPDKYTSASLNNTLAANLKSKVI